MKFTINRKKWFRGHGSSASGLLINDTNGQKCCLGQIACQLGVPVQALRGASTPEELPKKYAPLFKENSFLTRRGEDNRTTSRMMEVNDEKGMDDSERERKLQVLAKRLNHKLVFV